MALIERNYMIEEISAAVSYPTLSNPVLPGTSE